MSKTELRDEKRNDFFEHLGTCSRCDNNPFDLCPTGAALIKIAYNESIDYLAGVRHEQD